MKASDLNEEEREIFCEEFYEHAPDDNMPNKYGIRDNPQPAGMPWFYDPCEELIGETIEEMAKNYAVKIKDSVQNLIDYWQSIEDKEYE